MRPIYKTPYSTGYSTLYGNSRSCDVSKDALSYKRSLVRIRLSIDANVIMKSLKAKASRLTRCYHCDIYGYPIIPDRRVTGIASHVN